MFFLRTRERKLRNMDPITVLVADAHTILRRTLSRLLGHQQNIRVVGEAANGRQVLRRMRALQPDILLLDIRMPEMGELEGLPQIRAVSPRTKILILADFFDNEFIAGLLQDGAQGCLLKTVPPAELVKAICATHGGELWVQRKILTQLIERLRQKTDELQDSLSEMRGVLSDREQEVVIWAVQGMTNKQIATQLSISEKTVKTHLQHVFRKLNVRRRVQLSVLSRYLASPSPHAPPPAASLG
jgi:DNA-binding NarL/FixJ family response regulator